VLDPLWITPIGDQGGQPLGNPKPSLGLGEEHDVAV
jgi:hypothetical protein